MPRRINGERRLALLAPWAALVALTCAVARPSLTEAAPVIDASVLDEPGDRLFPEGKAIYRQRCASCHDLGAARAPQVTLLRYMSPEAIHRALTTGVMRAQAAGLTAGQKVEVSQFLSSRKLAGADDPPPPPHMCAGRAAVFDRNEPPVFTNWGLDLAGTHAIPPAIGGLTRANAGKLRLKWSFGFPGAERMRSQPALAGGAIFLGSHTGEVYALDRATGCVRWKFDAPSEVRTGIVVAPWRAGDVTANPLIYFGDIGAELYAVEAFTGRLVWKISADRHPAAVLTAAPSLHDGTLYVPVSSLEENSAIAPAYRCCTFRGSVLAVDAATGREKWRTWLVGEPEPVGGGKGLSGPSGVAVWNSPAIDPTRGQLTVATGDNYTDPATALSDSIVALDLATGRIKWHYQATENDRWNVACILPGHASCPEDQGPDYDFGAGTMLVPAGGGRELIIAGQKASMVHAVDPDTGNPLWHARVGQGGPGGGINFGLAAAGGRIFAPVADMAGGPTSPHPRRPGIHALDAATGREIWYAAVPGDCHGRQGCQSGTSGSVTVSGDLVIAGADDGHVRIHDAGDGKLLWDYDTSVELKTVNGVPARGGAISGGVAPLVWRGQLIVPSGYGFARKMPGNALLVFEVE